MMTMSCASNSQTAVEGLIARCTESLQHGKQGGMISLEAYRDAGLALVELKEILPRGEFGRVAAERCGCCKQWRARLMQVAGQWDDIGSAFVWAENSGSSLLQKAYSVDGALALLRAWRTVQNGERQLSEVGASRRDRLASLEREVANLRTKLTAGVAYIEVLEQELAGVSGIPNPEQQVLRPEDRNEIQNIATRWLHAGMGEEGLEAARQLRANAARLGWSLRELLHESGIEGPADWTSTQSPTER